MSSYTKIIFIIFFCTVLSTQNAFAEAHIPSKGEVFPDFTLPVPDNAELKNYLGVAAKSSFKISSIQSELIIIEIFSLYCPYCQKEAPLVDELYANIKKRGLKDRIKIIGIGAGNTPFEIDIFKQQYAVPFPLFPDETFAIHKAIGEVRTPYFFVLQNKGTDTSKIIYSKVGSIQDSGQFLDIILKESGMQ